MTKSATNATITNPSSELEALPTAPTTPQEPSASMVRPTQGVNPVTTVIDFTTGKPVVPGTVTATATPVVNSGDNPVMNPATEPETPSSEDTPKTFTQDQVNKMMADQRRALQKAADEAKAQAALTAEEKLAQEASHLKKELDQTRASLVAEKNRVAIIMEAGLLSLDATAAVKLIDSNSITFDDQGNPTNIKELVAAVATQYPGLVKSGRTSLPNILPVNPNNDSSNQSTRTDADRRREYFGGGNAAFWASGGVVQPQNPQNP